MLGGKKMLLSFDGLETPLGDVRLVMQGDGLCTLAFVDGWERAEAALRRRFGDVVLTPRRAPEDITSRLRAYFAGSVDALNALRVDTGGTPFQEAVWRALRDIPPGYPETYAGLAQRVGRTTASARAVGSANAANPIAVVVPCHRVVRSDTDVCGYAYGVERKRWLLSHEAHAAGPSLAPAILQPSRHSTPKGASMGASRASKP